MLLKVLYRLKNYKIVLFSLILFIIFCCGSIYYLLNSRINFTPSTLYYQITPGQSLSKLSRDLLSIGVLSSHFLFISYAKLLDKESSIQSGEYWLKSPLSAVEILDIFVRGKVIKYSISFIDGSSVKTLLSKLHNTPKIKQILQDVEHLRQKIVSIGGANVYPEGLFYADTYAYTAGETDWSILYRAYTKLHKILEQEWQNKQSNLIYSNSYQALIMASIVEKETFVAAERNHIAGVYLNRLNSNMRLQADPTVIYGLMLNNTYWGNLNRTNLKEYTPYNTYKIKGLPPTPISIVGREAIHAALHPLATDNIFFVAKPDGSHHFSATISEHNKAVNKYQRH